MPVFQVTSKDGRTLHVFMHSVEYLEETKNKSLTIHLQSGSTIETNISFEDFVNKSTTKQSPLVMATQNPFQR